MAERRAADDPASRKRGEWARFAGAEEYERRIGAFALAADRQAVLALLPPAALPPGARVLDLPSGAGRMSVLLADERRARAVAADYSFGMLRVARRRTAAPAVRCDAFATPFAAASFAAVVTLRLTFHYPDLGPLADEVGRVLAPGGRWLFDTLNSGSPRHAMEPLGRLVRRRRTGLHFRPPAAVAARLAAAGFEVERSLARYLVPTRLYRLAPGFLHPALRAVESAVPPARRVLTFWCARRRG